MFSHPSKACLTKGFCVTPKRCALLMFWSCNKLSIWTLLCVNPWYSGKYLLCSNMKLRMEWLRFSLQSGVNGALMLSCVQAAYQKWMGLYDLITQSSMQRRVHRLGCPVSASGSVHMSVPPWQCKWICTADGLQFNVSICCQYAAQWRKVIKRP